jgi:hypothetical protein
LPAATVLLIAAGFASCGSSDKKPVDMGDPVKQDAAAKADARNVVTLVEVCYTDSQSYVACTPAKVQAGNTGSGLAFGSAPGQVELVPAEQGYTVTAHSRSGNTFVITRDPSGATGRSCTVKVKGGCDNGRW